jgi:REP element-mobilizing transposase RayT
MQINHFGHVLDEEWLRTNGLRPNVGLDEYGVMPNHFHGVLVINERRGVLQYAPTNVLRSPSQTIGAIIRGFKSAVTKRINQIRNTPGHPVWQRNYYEHVIRNEDGMNRIREYIIANPAKWDDDENNPVNCRGEKHFAPTNIR